MATTDPHADADLLKRYRECPHGSITAMVAAGKDDLAVPNHAGKPVCLTWALKGSCSSTCKRKEQHVRYSRATVQNIHKYLDECGVAPLSA